MTLPSQQYALLANDAYVDRAVGVRPAGARERIVLDGEAYRIAAHVDNKKTGYQGTVYIRESTGEVIVGHRGTEFDREPYRDGIRADGAMVVNRSNPQAEDAIALTRVAREIDRVQRERFPATPAMTVTGHSLGGALAQVSAHHFGLKGETFNAYGAHSLGFRIPEGGNAMVNHVMATDFVSAASGHYGQVKVYATQGDITRLHQGGYANGLADYLVRDMPVVVAGRSVDAHKMHNFLPVDASGKPGISVLSDPQASRRAADNSSMIADYRNDIRQIRAGVTVLSRSGLELLQDAWDDIRCPLPPGEPARREQSSHLRIDMQPHPGFGLYQEAERGVLQLDAQAGRTPDQGSRQLAGALAAEMYVAGGQRIDAVMLSGNASHAFAVQGNPADPAHLRATVEVASALAITLEQSSVRVADAAQQPQSVHMSEQLELERAAQPAGPRLA